MKTLKIFAISLIALLFATSSFAQTSTSLTSSNGIAAGKALLSLYTQYKADGKLDLGNANNISNLVSLASNIKGLASDPNTKNFLSGLISGSKNLVTNSNSGSVLKTLTSIAGLDLSSLGTAAATSAATSLLGKVTGTQTSSSSNNAANVAASALTSLFSTLGK